MVVPFKGTGRRNFVGITLRGGESGTRTTSLVSVQALRALAAMSVVLVHFEYVGHALSGRINEQLSLYPLASGVDLFFAISGFIMVYSSAGLFTKDGAWRIFIARRLSRIVPLYWLMTAGAIAMFSAPESWQMLVSSLLFIPYHTVAGTFFPVDSGGWTLNYEMFFYALFACAIFLPRLAAAAAVGGFLLTLVATFRLFPVTDDRLLYWSDPIVLEFCIGMAIGLLHQQYSITLPAIVRLGMVAMGPAPFGCQGRAGQCHRECAPWSGAFLRRCCSPAPCSVRSRISNGWHLLPWLWAMRPMRFTLSMRLSEGRLSVAALPCL